MKPQFAALLRCPECRSDLALETHTVEGSEIVTGTMTCRGCARAYSIEDGIPWMAPHAALDDREKRRTASSFGHLWAQSSPTEKPARDYHFEKMASTLGFSAPAGLILDGGCGDGIDLANRASDPGVVVVGAELSAGGCRTTAQRILRLPNAHVVQADLAHLPFAPETFDFVYSYGVLHHMPVPADGLRELTRVAARHAPIAIYLYEDFSDRSLAWRILLRLANSFRAMTTRLPHPLLFGLCRIGSPIVFLMFTVPHKILTRAGILTSFAGSLPFRHGRGPFSMTGDLYDRFSAPVEYRYSRRSTAQFMEQAGLAVQRIAKERGWMALARRNDAPA